MNENRNRNGNGDGDDRWFSFNYYQKNTIFNLILYLLISGCIICFSCSISLYFISLPIVESKYQKINDELLITYFKEGNILTTLCEYHKGFDSSNHSVLKADGKVMCPRDEMIYGFITVFSLILVVPNIIFNIILMCDILYFFNLIENKDRSKKSKNFRIYNHLD